MSRLVTQNGAAEVRAGVTKIPDVTMAASYEPNMPLADGQMQKAELLSEHVELRVVTPGKEAEFFDLLPRACREFD